MCRCVYILYVCVGVCVHVCMCMCYMHVCVRVCVHRYMGVWILRYVWVWAWMCKFGYIVHVSNASRASVSVLTVGWGILTLLL